MSVQRSILRDNPPTAISNGGHKLRRYRVDGVIYARTVDEARRRLRMCMELDDALVVPPSKARAQR